MKILKQAFTFAASLALAALLAVTASLPVPVNAATQNYSGAINGVVVIPFHISGQYTATTASVVKFAMPFPCRIIGVGATARASGGTSPTLTVNLLDDGVSALSGAIAITAGTYAEGTIANAVVADESVMTVDLTIGGTSPTWNDITVLVTVVRE